MLKHRPITSGDKALRILNLGTEWNEWSASRYTRFAPGEGVHGTQWIGSRAGHAVGLAKKEFLFLREAISKSIHLSESVTSL